MRYFEMILNALLAEGIEDLLPAAIDKLLKPDSKWEHKDDPNAESLAREVLLQASELDPTAEKRYTIYVAMQLADGKLRMPEDADKLKRKLQEFSKPKKSKAFTQILLGPKSHWKHKGDPDAERKASLAVEKAGKFDPTSTKEFLEYLLMQMANNSIIMPEDGSRFRAVIAGFLRRGSDWPGKATVYEYPDWHGLEQAVIGYFGKDDLGEEELQSVREKDQEFRRIAKEGLHEIWSGSVGLQTTQDKATDVDKSGNPILLIKLVLYQCTNWQTIVIYGKGTEWCTNATPYTTKIVGKPDRWGHKVGTIEELLKKTIDDLTSKNDEDAIPTGIWNPKGDETYFLKMICDLNDIEPAEMTFQGVCDAIKAQGPRSFEFGRPGARESLETFGFRTPNPYLKQAVSYSNKYLNGTKTCRGGPVYLMTKNGEPYMQMAASPDEPQIKDERDLDVTHVGAVQRLIFYKMMAQVPATLQKIMKEAIKAGENRDKKKFKAELDRDAQAIPKMLAGMPVESLKAWLNGPTEEAFGQEIPLDEAFPFDDLPPEVPKKTAIGIIIRARRFQDTWFKFVKAVMDRVSL